MARDDAGGRSQGGSAQGSQSGRDSWDFELPDLGETTTPARQRVPRSSTEEPPRSRTSSREAPTALTRQDDSRPTASAPGTVDDSDRALAPEVYRRRRVVAVILALVVILAVGFGVMNLFNGRAQDDAQPAAAQPTNTDPFAGFSPRAQSQASDGATGPAARACGERLTVSASTDKEKYGEKDKPILIMSLKNTGDQPCMVNAGTARMNFTVSDGANTVFDSAACQIDGQDRPIELEPDSTETARFEWTRRQSVPDCATEGEKVNPGNYRVTVTLGETRSEGVEFTLE